MLLKLVFSYFISIMCMCNGCRVGEVVQYVGHGSSVCLSIGTHAWKGWEPLV